MDRSAKGHRLGISPALHSRIDFAAVLVMLLAPHALRLRPASVLLSTGLPGAGALLGAATDYPHPLHWSRRLSLQTHRGLERLGFPLCLWLPTRLGLLRSKPDRRYFLVLLAASVANHVLTDWNAGTDGEVAPSPPRTQPS